MPNSKICPNTLKFCQSGEILPSLVTLVRLESSKFEQKKKFKFYFAANLLSKISLIDWQKKIDGI